jgi:ribonuclease P protein component
MLPKQERLTTAEFDNVLANWRVVRNDLLHLKYVVSQDKKFAIAVPKKIVKTSIMRHFVKRRIYNILRGEKNTFPNGHFVIFVSKELLACDVNTTQQALHIIAQKVAS